MISRRTFTPVTKLQRLLLKQLDRRASPHRDDYRFQVTRLFARDLAEELRHSMFREVLPLEQVLDMIELGRLTVAGVRVRVVGGPWPYMAEIVKHASARWPRPYLAKPTRDWLA